MMTALSKRACGEQEDEEEEEEVAVPSLPTPPSPPAHPSLTNGSSVRVSKNPRRKMAITPTCSKRMRAERVTADAREREE
jgi:hypothetical protein